MRFRVLGPLEVTGIPVAGRRQRTLLALLLARGGEVLPTGALTAQLWGDAPPRDTTAALHNLVSRLRRTLGDTARLVTHAAGYRLETAPDDVDAQHFAALVDAARAPGLAPSEVDQLLTRGLELWRGTAYHGFEDLPDLQPEVTRLHELRTVAREERADARLRAGDPAGALADLEPLVHDEPLRERTRERYLRALYALGRHADALADLRAYRALLAGELGLEPSAGLQDLERAILRHEVAPPATAGTARVAFRDLRVGYLRLPDGQRLAVSTVGDGPPVVVVPAWVTSLDVIASGRDPRSSVLERLSRDVRLTLYDRYGTGLSAGPITDTSLEASVAELVAVVESAGPPVTLLAMSQSGPVAVTAAAHRPDLVSRLVLFGTYADGPATFPPEIRDAMGHLVRTHWGLGARAIAELYRPGCSALFVRHLGRVLQDSADREAAASYLEAGYAYDCVPLLASVRAPALIVHYRDDRVIPFRGGRQLAAGLPNARFLPLDGGFHLPDAADLDRIVAAITDFLPSTQRS